MASAGADAPAEPNVQVCVRVRPATAGESAWAVSAESPNSLQLLDAKGKPATAYGVDHVITEAVSTRRLFDVAVKGLVKSVVDGYNGTVFAYGQTAAGKTHTMLGDKGNPGILPLAVNEIMGAFSKAAHRAFLIRCSYVEIYKETVTDLLGKKTLEVHESKAKGVYLEAQEEVISTADDILACLAKGEDARHVGRTGMNERSSRSHTIFRITVESRAIEGDGDRDVSSGGGGAGGGGGAINDGAVLVGTLNLVDLAGSESVRTTNAVGERLVEAKMINTSLLALSRIIKDLADTGKSLNYRSSKLTRVLQPSLAGNTKLTIICCINPSRVYLEESRTTLDFACSAKGIRTTVGVNTAVDDATKMRALQKELNAVREQLKQLQTGGTAATAAISAAAGGMVPTSVLSSALAGVSVSIAAVSSSIMPLASIEVQAAGSEAQAPPIALVLPQDPAALIAHYEAQVAAMRSHMFIGGQAQRGVSEAGFGALGRVRSALNQGHQAAMGRGKRHRETWCPAVGGDGSGGGGGGSGAVGHLRRSFLNDLRKASARGGGGGVGGGSGGATGMRSEREDGAGSVIEEGDEEGGASDSEAEGTADGDSDGESEVAEALQGDGVAVVSLEPRAKSRRADNVRLAHAGGDARGSGGGDASIAIPATSTIGCMGVAAIVTAAPTPAVAEAAAEPASAYVAQIEALQATLAARDAALVSAHEQFDALLERNEGMEGEVQRWEQAAAAALANSAAADAASASAREEASVAVALVAEMRAATVEAATLSASTGAALDEALAARSVAETMRDEAIEARGTAEKLAEVLITERDAALAAAQSATSALAEAHAALSAAHSAGMAAEAATERWKAEYDEVADAFEAATTDLSATQAQVATLTAAIAQAEASAEILRAAAAEREALLCVAHQHALHEASEASSALVDTLKGELAAAGAAYEGAVQQNEDLTERLTTATAERASFIVERDGFIGALAQAEAREREVRTALAARDSMLASLEASAGEQGSQVGELLSRLGEAEQKLTAARVANEAGERTAAALQFKLTGAEEDAEAAGALVEELEAKLCSAQASAAAAIAALTHERDDMRAALLAEHGSIATERDRVIAERDAISAERDTVVAERDAAAIERINFIAERDGIIAERDGVIIERNGVVSERDGYAAALMHAAAVGAYATELLAALRRAVSSERPAAVTENEGHNETPGARVGAAMNAFVEAWQHEGGAPAVITSTNWPARFEALEAAEASLCTSVPTHLAHLLPRLALPLRGAAEDLTLELMESGEAIAGLARALSIAVSAQHETHAALLAAQETQEAQATLLIEHEARAAAIAVQHESVLLEAQSAVEHTAVQLREACIARDRADAACADAMSALGDSANGFASVQAGAEVARAAAAAAEERANSLAAALAAAEEAITAKAATVAGSTSMLGAAQAEISCLKVELGLLADARAGAESEAADARAAASVAKEALMHAQSAATELRAALAVAQTDAAEAHAAVAAAEAELEAVRLREAAVGASLADLASAHAQAAAASEEANALRSQLQGSHTSAEVLRVAQASKSALAQENAALSLEATRLGNAITAETSKVNALRGELAAVQAQLASATDAHAAAQRAAAAAIEANEVSSAAAATSLMQLGLEAASLRAALERRDAQVAAAAAEAAAAIVRAEGADLRAAALAAQLDDASQAAAAALHAAGVSAAADASAAASAHAEIAASLAIAHSALVDARALVAERSAAVEEVSTVAAALRGALAAAEATAAGAASQAASARSRAHAAEALAAARGSDLASTAARADALRSALAEREADVVRLTARVDKLQRTRLTEAQVQRMLTIKKEHAALAQRAATLTGENAALTAQLAAAGASSNEGSATARAFAQRAAEAEAATQRALRESAALQVSLDEAMAAAEDARIAAHEAGEESAWHRSAAAAARAQCEAAQGVQEAVASSAAILSAALASGAAVLMAAGLDCPAPLRENITGEGSGGRQQQRSVLATLACAREGIDALCQGALSAAAAHAALRDAGAHAEAAAAARANALEAELVAARNEVEAARTALSTAHRDGSDTSGALTAARSRIAELERAIAAAGVRYTALERAASDAARTASDKERATADAAGEHARATAFLERENLALMMELRSLRTQVAAAPGILAANLGAGAAGMVTAAPGAGGVGGGTGGGPRLSIALGNGAGGARLSLALRGGGGGGAATGAAAGAAGSVTGPRMSIHPGAPLLQHPPSILGASIMAGGKAAVGEGQLQQQSAAVGATGGGGQRLTGRASLYPGSVIGGRGARAGTVGGGGGRTIATLPAGAFSLDTSLAAALGEPVAVPAAGAVGGTTAAAAARRTPLGALSSAVGNTSVDLISMPKGAAGSDVAEAPAPEACAQQ